MGKYNATEGWAGLGRGYNHDTNYLRSQGQPDELQCELKRLELGTINCTCWASLIEWFMTHNGVYAKKVKHHKHEYVVTWVKDPNGGVRLCAIGVSESAPRIEDAKIHVRYITDTRRGPEGFRSIVTKSDFEETPEPSEYEETIEGNGDSPLQLHLDELTTTINFTSNGFEDKAKMEAQLKGIISSVEDFEKEGLTNGSSVWDMKIVPRSSKGVVTIPINLKNLSGTCALDPEWHTIEFMMKNNPQKLQRVIYVIFQLPETLLTFDKFSKYKVEIGDINWDTEKVDVTLTSPGKRPKTINGKISTGGGPNPREIPGWDENGKKLTDPPIILTAYGKSKFATKKQTLGIE
jgi:hypothetical protein